MQTAAEGREAAVVTAVGSLAWVEVEMATAVTASPPLLLSMPLPLVPLLLPLALPRLLLLMIMTSAQAIKARRGQNHVIGPLSAPTEVTADGREIWKGATHAGGEPAG